MTTPSGTRPPAVLTAYDCWRLLPTEEVARVAWSGPDGTAIVPVNYTVTHQSLWFRTQPYSALGRQVHGGRVAVEVDHVDHVDKSAWSVVAIGTAQVVDGDEVPDSVLQMRVWVPGPRSLVVRVDPVEVTGRRLWGRADANR
ncbi:pyridoxamine 5'-phosphate oxidase family protein [Nocardioides sp. CER19]|uniref:pyridoxamine 5'-phosphate oxidase family protein n=1 Tax=Nocardioides sp. CER19 TaxID=3038538 RepID=UPI00244B5B1D|nr:pyridoxamine 5'-phosphate oxidase family protein [Nocardioides sp. CER19]MDH2412769.1 pyridoxamine 5'-phosphate oxidase family protein [Nocardioides sp. CER19]